jgi:hypothetical protein
MKRVDWIEADWIKQIGKNNRQPEIKCEFRCGIKEIGFSKFCLLGLGY